jgi:hypothetical protein
MVKIKRLRQKNHEFKPVLNSENMSQINQSKVSGKVLA